MQVAVLWSLKVEFQIEAVVEVVVEDRYPH
jgi:hypothetical protein